MSKKKKVSLEKNQLEVCILHSNVKVRDEFVYLKNVCGGHQEKLSSLHEIRDEILYSSESVPKHIKAICDNIPESVEDNIENVGYHKMCYLQFTTFRKKKIKASSEKKESNLCRHQSQRNKERTLESSKFFPDECIFCDKIELYVNDKTERTKKFTLKDAWEKIEEHAKQMGNIKLYAKVKDIDLFAVNAKKHEHCQIKFARDHFNFMKKSNKGEIQIENEQSLEIKNHNQAFQVVLDYIRSKIIVEKQIIKLSALKSMYVNKLDELNCPNKKYRNEKLKRRMENHPEISSKIAFTKINEDDQGYFSFYIVYSSDLSVDETISLTYKLANADEIKDTAHHLHGTIIKAYKESKNIPWPPTADDLDVNSNPIPEPLKLFLKLLLTGKNHPLTSEKTDRLINSIGQDICRAATNDEWKLTKHILLCASIRHLYRSKQLTNILFRLGHCESYEFSLDLEYAQAKVINEASSLLTPKILTGESNILFHSEWDNLNKIMTNIHGCNVVNSAGGIMIQEVSLSPQTNQAVRSLPTTKRDHKRSQIEPPPSLVPIHLYDRNGPKFPNNASFKTLPDNEQHMLCAMKHYYLWLFSRNLGSCGQQTVPALGGFISVTGKKPEKKSTIDYYFPINEPITEYSTVSELLKQSSEATSEVGQKYVITTFDLGVVMKAMPLIWKWPDHYKDHIVLIGQFHTVMNYIGMLCNHKMLGSGYAEILIEAELVTSGCLKGALSGKAYAKALFGLKTLCEAMERLLIEQFIENENVKLDDPTAILLLVKECNRETLDNALKDPTTLELITKYQKFEEKVRNGLLGKTAVFWFSFIEHARLVFMLLYSVKVNNFNLFHQCMGQMAELFFCIWRSQLL